MSLYVRRCGLCDTIVHVSTPIGIHDGKHLCHECFQKQYPKDEEFTCPYCGCDGEH